MVCLHYPEEGTGSIKSPRRWRGCWRKTGKGSCSVLVRVAERYNYPFRELMALPWFSWLLLAQAVVEKFLREGLCELLQLLGGNSDFFRDIPKLACAVLGKRRAMLSHVKLHEHESDFALPFGIHRILLSKVRLPRNLVASISKSSWKQIQYSTNYMVLSMAS